MATVVGILDRAPWDSRTDIIVLVEPKRRSLTWIPRDLWCPSLNDRVNTAFRNGGNERLLGALAELGFHADYALCLSRTATESALAEAVVEVPVEAPLDFWYPLTPTSRIQEGQKLVSFRPPGERLSGERIHQWIGARRGVSGGYSDLHRISRQKVFLRALLQQGFDFSAVVKDPSLVQLSDKGAIDELRLVDASWRMATFRRVRQVTIDGKIVLVPEPGAAVYPTKGRRRRARQSPQDSPPQRSNLPRRKRRPVDAAARRTHRPGFRRWRKGLRRRLKSVRRWIIRWIDRGGIR